MEIISTFLVIFLICTASVSQINACVRTLKSSWNSDLDLCKVYDGDVNDSETVCCNDLIRRGLCHCYATPSFHYKLGTLTKVLHVAPKCPKALQISVLVSTSERKDHVSEYDIRDSASIKSAHNWLRPTKIITHGFGSSAWTPWVRNMTHELLSFENTNVVALDWSQGARSPYDAPANVKPVGDTVASLVIALGIPLQHVHLIGHSLGAHVMGRAGQIIQETMKEKLGRISGLDPAGPGFEHRGPSDRLDPSDAEFVDVIHSNAESLKSLGFGIQRPVGHVDFYPNGGQHQPGCPAETFGLLLSLLVTKGSLNPVICSHSRAHAYFTNSIRTCSYLGPQVPAHCPMGYHASQQCRGTMIPITKAVSPFC